MNISICATQIFTLLLASMPVVVIAQILTSRVVSVGDGDTLRVVTGEKILCVLRVLTRQKQPKTHLVKLLPSA